MHRHAEEEVVADLAVVAQHGDLPSGIECPDRDRTGDSMARSANAARNASDAAGDGGTGTGSGRTNVIVGLLPQTAFGQQVVHQQRRLARGGRALERGRCHPDDHPSALERRQHVTAREGTGLGVELVTALLEARRRRHVEIGAECHDQHVGVEGAGVGLDPLGRRIDGLDRRLHESHTGLDDVGVAVTNPRRSDGRTSRRASRSRTRSRRSGRSAQCRSSVAELVGQRRRQLEPSEAGAEHDDPHRGCALVPLVSSTAFQRHGHSRLEPDPTRSGSSAVT